MNSIEIHQLYHSGIKLQKRIITDTNFVYVNLIEFVKPYLKKQSEILDIGCGVGTMDFYLVSRGHEVAGMDISKNAIEMARLNSKNLGLEGRINFLIREFPYNLNLKKQFDLIIASEVLEHLEDDKKALEEMKNLLKKNGILIITVPLKSAPLYRLGMLSEFDKKVGHVRRYTKEDLFDLIQSTGLSVRNYEFKEGLVRNLFFTNRFLGKLVRFLIFPISYLITLIDNISLFLFGPSQILVVVTK